MVHQSRGHFKAPITDSDETLAQEISATWFRAMSRWDWLRRLELMEEIVRLVANRPGLDRIVVSRLIADLGAGPIRCREQALFYLMSADENWQAAARDWLETQA